MVYILEIENGLKITETIGGDVVVRYLTTFGFPFIRSTNELGATYQVVDTVGEIYNLPTVPSDFTLENINGNVYLSVTGDELIENSLNLKPFRRENLEDRVISLGTIVTTSSAVTVNLPSSGINSILINGNTREKYIKSQFTFTPVTTGIKVLIIYGLDTSEMLYLSEGTEGVEAVEPSIPTGALFVARVIVSSTGTIIEEEDFGYKFKADDAWRQFTIGATPLIVSIGSSNASSFEFLTTEVSPVFGGIITKLGKNNWDGKRYYLKNSSDKDIALEPTVIPEVGQAKAFTFAESYVLKKESWAIIDIVNGAFEMMEFGGGSDPLKLDKPLSPNNVPTRVILGDGSTKNLSDIGLDNSSLVDKMHSYWDSTLGKFVSSGLKFIADIIPTLEFLGRIKADAIILENNTNPVVANRLRSDGSKLYYSDNSATPVEKALLMVGDAGLTFDSWVDTFFNENIQWNKPNFNSASYFQYNGDGSNLFQAGQSTTFGKAYYKMKGVLYTSNTTTLARCHGNYMGFNETFDYSSFNVFREFSIDTNISTQRVFVGYSDMWRPPGSNPTNVAMSTLTNVFGVCMESGNPNILLIHNDNTGSASLIDTGFVHNVKYIYGIYFSKKAGETFLTVKLRRFDTETGIFDYWNYNITSNYYKSGGYAALWNVDSLGVSAVKVCDYGLIKFHRRYNL